MSVISNDLNDLISRLGGGGSRTASIHQQIYGINSMGSQPTMPLDKDHFGLTFFTRPRLNLSQQNLRAVEEFSPLLAINGDKMDLAQAVRCILDPPGVYRGDTSPLVDNRQAFIPWLTNGIQSCSGWPDLSAGTYVSEEGNYHEQWAMIDDTLEYYRSWQMSGNFRNSLGDIILLLFYVWVKYATSVFEDVMRPYPDAIIEDEIDYYSKCIRFRLDESRQRITQWGSTLCFPKSIPTGTTMNFSADSPLNDEGRQHTIQFDAVGFEWNHPATLKEFNVIVEHFNPDMSDQFRSSRMKQLHSSEYALFNYSTYLRVNLANNNLERWVDLDEYNLATGQLSKFYSGQ